MTSDRHIGQQSSRIFHSRTFHHGRKLLGSSLKVAPSKCSSLTWPHLSKIDPLRYSLSCTVSFLALDTLGNYVISLLIYLYISHLRARTIYLVSCWNYCDKRILPSFLDRYQLAIPDRTSTSNNLWCSPVSVNWFNKLVFSNPLLKLPHWGKEWGMEGKECWRLLERAH